VVGLKTQQPEIPVDQEAAALLLIVVAQLAEELPLHQGKEMLEALVETILETMLVVVEAEQGLLETTDKIVTVQEVMV
jgi:hypothetical protein